MPPAHPDLENFPEYRPIRKLADSTDSVVWLLEREGKRFVLRLGRPGARWGGDAQALARMSGPGFATPKHWGRTPSGRPHVLRTFIPGDHFDIAARSADVETLVRWTRLLLDSLESLHSKGLVHRDIKASNVLIAEDRPVLVDFDLIASAGLSDSGISGTALHIAPEVLLSQPHRPGADLYSLGAMLALMLCGAPSPTAQLRFPHNSFWEATQLDPLKLPPELAPLVRALVHRHPNDRPSTAREAKLLLPEADLAPRDPALPFLAGREWFLDELCKHEGPIVVAVEDADEIDLLAREVHLRTSLEGSSSVHIPLTPEDSASDLLSGSFDETGLTLSASFESAAAVVDEFARSLVHAFESPTQRLIFILPTGVAERISSDLAAEKNTTVRLDFPRTDEATLRGHIEALSDAASPKTAEALARSLCVTTGCRWHEINRRLARAIDDGVLRPQGSSYVLLTDEWPQGTSGAAFFEDEVKQLPVRARSLLAIMALLGEQATPERIRRVSDLSETDYGSAQGILLRRGILTPGTTRDATPLFSDARWLETCARSLSGKERIFIHTQCERVLRSEEASEEVLAIHQFELATGAKDLGAILDVAERLRDQGRLGRARRLAANVLQRAGSRMKSVRERATVLCARLEIGQGNAVRALEIVKERFGEDLAGAGNTALLVAAEAAELAGQRTLGRTLFERVLTSKSTAEERLRAMVGIGYIILLDGDPHGVLRATSVLPKASAADEPAGALWNLRSGAFAQLGRHIEAGQALDEAMQRAVACGDPTLLGRTLLNRAYLDRRRGNLTSAFKSLEEASRAFDRADHVKLRALAANNLGVLLRDLGDLATSRKRLRESYSLRRRVSDAHGAASSLASLGIVELEAGQLGSAITTLERALQLFRKGEHTGELTYVGTHYTIALALSGRWNEADELLRGPDLADAQKHHPLVHARARAACYLAAREQRAAVKVLQEACQAKTGATEDSERYRAASWLISLDPTSQVACRLLKERSVGEDEAPTDAQRCETLWLTRTPGQPVANELLAEWIEVLEAAGRTNLVHTVASVAALQLDRAGRFEQRRSLVARTESAADALVGALPPEDRAAALERIDRLCGRGGPPAGKSKRLDVDWIRSWNRRLAAEDDLENLLLSTVDMALEVTGANRGFLVLLCENGSEVRAARGLNEEDSPSADVQFSLTVIQEAVKQRTTIVASDASKDERFASAVSVRSLGLRSILCVPFSASTGLQGALYLDNHHLDAGFDRYDERIVGSLTDQAAIAIAQINRLDEIRDLNRRLEEQVQLRDDELMRARSLIRSTGESPPSASLVGESPAIKVLLDQIDRFAGTDLPILIHGPGGSKRSQVARGIHERSSRSKAPFLMQNLGTLPPELFEAELFGHVQGAFAGAGRNRSGLFARVGAGTLYLDEIDGLPLDQQAVLLHALQTGEYRPVGSSRTVKTRFRLLTTSHKDLPDLVARGEFLLELYLHINAIELSVPPLADRVRDIPLLIQHFVAELNAKQDKNKTITDRVIASLVRRPWMGEVRELSNEVTRLYFLADAIIDAPENVRDPHHRGGYIDPMPASYRLDDVERAAIARALHASRQQKEKAARLLCISRAGLYTKMRRLGLLEKRDRSAAEGKGGP